jgi:hypothetical protein
VYIVHIPSFIAIGYNVQAILWLLLEHFRVFSVFIADGRDLRTTPLRWPQVACTYQISCQFVEVVAELLTFYSHLPSGLLELILKEIN